MSARPWLINGSLLVEPGDGVVFEPYALRIAVIDWERKRLLTTIVRAQSLLRVIAEIIKEKPAALTIRREHSCEPYGCDKVYLPDMETIAELLLALRSVLSAAPSRALEAEDDDGMRYTVWSSEEAAAARKAAILLDIVAMLLKNPKEMLQKLPSEIEMLVNK